MRLATSYRTHTCGELRKEHAGAAATICGAIDALAGPAQFDLRDAYGRTQVRLSAAAGEMLEATKTRLTPETVLQVYGTVAARESADPEDPTGEVYLDADEVLILSVAKTPLLFDFRSSDIPREERIRHRYLYLRRPAAHRTFAFRTRALQEARRWLDGRGFVEVETPLLANRWTPEAREYFLAIRNRAEIFALPGHRPVHGPLLMSSGFDRTYEIARRFRRKPRYGPWQQPEFDVFECMMAFVSAADLFGTADALIAHVWRTMLGEEPPPVVELSWEEAQARYGSDAPDLRFDATIRDATGDRKDGAIRALHVPGGAPKVAGEGADALALFAAERTRPGPRAPGAMGWVLAAEEAPEGRVFREGVEAPLDPELSAYLLDTLGARPGDLVLFALAKDAPAAHAAAAALRAEAGRSLGLADPKKRALVRISELPYYRLDPAAGGFALAGDPLSRPVEGDLEGKERHAVRAQAAYWVLDGVNIGGGSIRNHDIFTQLKIFDAFGLSPLEIDARYAQVLRFQRFGTPPFGRFSFGVDRLMALMLGLPSIDEVIPLPKMPDGNDPLARAPWPIETSVIRGLFGL